MNAVWVIPDEEFREALRRAHAGEDPEMIIVEFYANCEVENVDPDDHN